jgi:hypothetical protein
MTKFNEAVNLIIKSILSDQTGIHFFQRLRCFSRKIKVWEPKNHSFEIFTFLIKSVLISLISGVDSKTTDEAFFIYFFSYFINSREVSEQFTHYFYTSILMMDTLRI